MPAVGETAAGLGTVGLLVLLLAVAYIPLGDYMAAVLTPVRHSRL